MTQWRNWSGSVVATPARFERPRSSSELQRLVGGASRVRVVGAGHSFMPLCETDGLLLNLEDMDGGLEVSSDRASVWAPAGWPIAKLTRELWKHGLSLGNQGDIDKQSIAGAIGTGTHGTGRTLGSISSFALGFRLVVADGSIIECDAEREPDVFQAARVGLGMLGVMERVKLTVAPAFRLRETLRRVHLAEILEQWNELADAHRHVEFFVFPYADHALLKILDVVAEGDDPEPGPDPSRMVFQAACDMASVAPSWAPVLQRLLARGLGSSSRAGPAWSIFPSERDIRFEEMEGEIPAAAGPDALRVAIAQVRERRLPIMFPFEYRAVAGDDIWLSPMNAGPCVSISFHQYAKMPWADAFGVVESVFKAHGSRPHWAKRHTLTSEDVLRLYPMARRWGAARRRVDPAGKFMNRHLRDVFAFSLEDVRAPADLEAVV